MRQWLVVTGVQDPSPIEFLQNPDFRQMAAFFLGWVFFSSFQLIACSKMLQKLLSFNRPFSRSCSHAAPDIEAHTSRTPDAPSPEKTPMRDHTFLCRQLLRANEGHALILTLAICFASASVAHFASLLDFSTHGGGTACAFVVACGGMTGQAARLIGLLILGQELRRLGVQRYEAWLFYAVLGVALGLVFANIAIGVGTTRYVPQLGISLCYRRHFMPTSLASTCLRIVLDIYVVARTMTFITPPFLRWRHQVETITDFRILRALSLLLLDALTTPSDVIPTNLLLDFIPFSVGALVVLAVFASPVKLNEDGASETLPDVRHSSVRFIARLSPGSTASIIRTANEQLPSTVSSRISADSVGSIRGPAIECVDLRTRAPQSSPTATETSPRPLTSSMPQSWLPRNLSLLRRSPTLSLPRLSVENSKQPSTVAPIPASASRQILPDQAKYVEWFDQEQSLPPGPSWKKWRRPQVSIIITDDRRESVSESHALTSAILGSDIIRSNSAGPANPTSATADPARTSSDETIMPAFSPVSSGRVSFTVPYSTQTSRDALEIVHEGDVTHPEQRKPRPSYRKPTLVERRNTFGSRPPSLKRVPSVTSPPPPVPGLSFLASPARLGPHVRHPPTPSGPRPLVPFSESHRSPPPTSHRS